MTTSISFSNGIVAIDDAGGLMTSESNLASHLMMFS